MSFPDGLSDADKKTMMDALGKSKIKSLVENKKNVEEAQRKHRKLELHFDVLSIHLKEEWKAYSQTLDAQERTKTEILDAHSNLLAATDELNASIAAHDKFQNHAAN